MAVQRARESWDALTGGARAFCASCGRWADPFSDRCCERPDTIGGPGRYSDAAAAAILDVALALWADTAAAMGEVDSGA